MPALANAHDHARVARLSQVGSYDVPLEAWLPYLTLIPAVDPWLASAVSFGRTARGGVGSVMAHYTRVQGLTDFPTEARAVAKAARDVGIRIALAVHCRDLNPLVYDPHDKLLAGYRPRPAPASTKRFLRPPLPAADQVAMVDAVAADIEGDGVTRPVWTGRRAMVHRRDAAADRRGVGAHRPPRPHASAGDALPAQLGRPHISRRASSAISTRSAWSTNGCRSRIASICGPTRWS